MTAINLTTKSDADLEQLRLDVLNEQDRRSIVANAAGRADSDSRTYLDAVGQVDGAEWKQPTGAFDAYPKDWQVTKDGKTWASLVPANVWEPPANWHEVTGGGVLPEWVQPSGAGDAYSFGDRVQHNGHAWTSNNPGEHTNTWEPSVYGWDDSGAV